MHWQDNSVLHKGHVLTCVQTRPFQLNATYMDALSLPSIQSMMRRRERVQPYIRTFFEVFASIPDGICWSSPCQNRALEAHVAFQVCSTTVSPILPSRHSCLYNLGKYAFATPLLRYCFMCFYPTVPITRLPQQARNRYGIAVRRGSTVPTRSRHFCSPTPPQRYSCCVGRAAC